MSALRFQHFRRVFTVAVIVLATLPGTSSFAQDMRIDGIWLPDNSRSERLPSPLPFSAKGQQSVTAWRAGRDPQIDDPGRFCQSPGMPTVLLSGAGYPTEMVIAADQVLMLFEAHQLVRRIALDSERPKRLIPQRNGYSSGRWDNDTLVVNTTDIRPIFFGSVPHSDQVQVLERLWVIDEGQTLVNEITITDPVIYAEPMTVERYFTLAPEGSQMLEYECTEAQWSEHQESRGLEPFAL